MSTPIFAMDMPSIDGQLATRLDYAFSLWQAFYFAALYETADFAKIPDQEIASDFADTVRAGRIVESIENIKRACLFRGVELPDPILGTISFGSLSPGKPLPEVDRIELTRLAREVLWPIVCRLEVEEHRANKPDTKDRRGAFAYKLRHAWATGKIETMKDALEQFRSEAEARKWKTVNDTNGLKHIAENYQKTSGSPIIPKRRDQIK